GMTFLSIVGGMPESTFLVLAFACLYFMCRLLFVAEFRADFLASLGRFAAAIVLGFCLSAFLLLPFVEFLQIGHDVHQPSNIHGDRTGLNADGSAVAMIFYLLPLIFGPVNNSILSEFLGWTGLRSYWGIVPCILAMMAVFSLIKPIRDSSEKGSRFLTIFFVVTL